MVIQKHDFCIVEFYKKNPNVIITKVGEKLKIKKLPQHTPC